VAAGSRDHGARSKITGGKLLNGYGKKVSLNIQLGKEGKFSGIRNLILMVSDMMQRESRKKPELGADGLNDVPTISECVIGELRAGSGSDVVDIDHGNFVAADSNWCERLFIEVAQVQRRRILLSQLMADAHISVPWDDQSHR
jgi:hypothetical protein